MAEQYKKRIQDMRKTIIYQLFSIEGCLLEHLNETTQEMFVESMLEVLKENRGTKKQYIRLIEISIIIRGVEAYMNSFITKYGNDK